MDIELETQLLPNNLSRIDRLTRRGLLRFLDMESSKASTSRLRSKARLIAVRQSGVEVNMDLARIEEQLAAGL